MAWLAGIPRRVGYVRYGRGLLLTDSLAASARRRGPLPAHADRRVLPGPGEDAGLPRRLRPARAADHSARRGGGRSGVGRAWDCAPNQPVVCLNTGGAFGPAKNWPTASFAELAQRLVQRAVGLGSRALRTGRARDGAGDRAAGRPSRGGQPGRPAAEPGTVEGLRPSRGAADHDRLRARATSPRRSGRRSSRCSVPRTSPGREPTIPRRSTCFTPYPAGPARNRSVPRVITAA